MASDWIKMRVDLHRDPAVISIARACRLDAYAVVGRLHAVWAWADSITADGLLPGMDLDVIDQIANRKGFGQAMTATPGTPWLVERDGGLEVPLFGRHNGQSAKSRALARDRKVAERDRSSRPRTHAVTLAGGQASRTKRDASVTREEKRREREENYGKLLPAADAAGPGSAKPRRAPSGPVQE
ncbi:MAG TPA: hypothetical protein VFD43_02025, partial [Planctomycetota bacterium]|nr:hypothetical protein [Planctomycetota bacterium]